MRRIVLTRGHELLRDAWQKRTFSVAADFLETRVATKSGMKLDSSYHPTQIVGPSRYRAAPSAALGFAHTALHAPEAAVPAPYAIRADFDDQAAIENFKRERADEVIGVYADPAVFALPYCGQAPVGDNKAVFQKLGDSILKDNGLTGKGIRLAVVDTGIDGSVVPAKGGWSPNPGYTPGSTSPPQHGTMCAFDITITAPDADILDYALLQSPGPGWSGFLSDAVRAYAELLRLLQQQPGPLVVNNSWGMFDRRDDAPIGSPENYSANPNHPFNQIVGSLVAAGADVCFAAGNCGVPCHDDRCGTEDVGPGKSIHGANSHPDVITVAAVTVQRERLGYSSQGPGGLTARKPDVAGYSHFMGSNVQGEPDSGTSAASPVVAGVVAALRQKFNNVVVPPASMKGVLQRSALDVNGGGWDFDLGYGVVNAEAAYQMLSSKQAIATAAVAA